MSQRPIIFPDDEEASQRLNRKAKESPFMVAGIFGLVGAVAYSAYKFKHRGEMSTSVYLMHTRVIAQGTVVACLAGGVAFTMFNKYILNKSDD